MATITIPALAFSAASFWFQKYPNAKGVWVAADGKLFLNETAALAHDKINKLPKNAWYITPAMVAAQPNPELAKAEKDLANANAEMADAKAKQPKTKTETEA